MVQPPIEPREAEAIPVTLARIEGSVSGVAKDIAHVLEKVEDHGAEILQHRGQIGSLQSDVQQIRSDQITAGKDLLAADMPTIPIVNSTPPGAYSSKVHGFVGSGNAIEYFNTVSLS